MERIFAMAFLAATFQVSAEESYLYWMMDSESAQAFDYSSVRIRVDGTGADDQVYMNLYSGDSGLTVAYGTAVDRTIAESAAANQVGMWAGIASVYARDGFSYVIELLNSESSVNAVAWINSDAIDFAKAGNLTGVTLAMGGVFAAAPEPNSALLIVLGCALLGLRRRNGNMCICTVKVEE